MTERDTSVVQKRIERTTFASLVATVVVLAPVAGAWIGLGWRYFRWAAGW